MPQLPRYESQRDLTTQQPSMMAPESKEGKILEKVAETAGQMQETTAKWNLANNSMQKTQAELNLKTTLLDIHARADADPDKNAYKKYHDEVNQALEKSTQGFSDPRTEAEAKMQLGYEAKAAQIQLNGLFRKKQIVSDQVNTKTLIDMIVNNPTEESFNQIKSILDKKEKIGVFGPDDVYTLTKKANEDLGINRINKDLYSSQTPEEVENVRDQINSGFYEKGGVTIDPEKKRALLDLSDRVKANVDKKLVAQQQEAITQNRMETITGIASGNPAYQQIDMTAIAERDPQLAQALTKAKDFMVNYNPKLPPKEQAMASAGLVTTDQIVKMKNYAKSIMDVFMINDNQKLGDFVVQELEKKGDGLTPSIKIAAFSNLAYLKAKVNNQQSQGDMQASDRYNSIKNAVMFLKASNPYLAPSLISDFIVKNYLSGSSSPDKVMLEAKDVLKKKAIEKNANIAKLPFTPNKVVDGEATVEDLHDGLNELDGEQYSGNRSDTNSAE